MTRITEMRINLLSLTPHIRGYHEDGTRSGITGQ